MIERREGWYWVKGMPKNEWECAQWDGHWRLPGYDGIYDDDDLATIGPRIPTPDEPWQTVPKTIYSDDYYSAIYLILMDKLPYDGESVQLTWEDLLSAAPKPEDV